MMPIERLDASVGMRVRRWEHEHVVEAAFNRLEMRPDATVEHAFATLKSWIGHTNFDQ